jgi:hypothetical protein
LLSSSSSRLCYFSFSSSPLKILPLLIVRRGRSPFIVIIHPSSYWSMHNALVFFICARWPGVTQINTSFFTW